MAGRTHLCCPPRLLVPALVFALSLASAPAAASTPAKPNVLFIVVDDLAPAFEQYGSPAKTPNMGRLAAKGVQFDRAYVSVAVCGPSRTAFLTGLRPDTSQVWTIGPYFRNMSRGQGMRVKTLPQTFRDAGYNATGAGKIFHPGTPSGGINSHTGGGDMCPGAHPSRTSTGCPASSGTTDVGSWSEPYWFCDQYTNDTVQSPAMQQQPCSLHGEARATDAVYAWPSCGGGCVQDVACIACFEKCGTWGQQGNWDACDCPDRCYPEGLIADQTIRVLKEKAALAAAAREAGEAPPKPWFHAMGLKRPHLSYRAPKRFFDQYDLGDIAEPLHPLPAPSAPAISYSHSCQLSTHTSGGGGGGDNGSGTAAVEVTVEDLATAGQSLYINDDGGGDGSAADSTMMATASQCTSMAFNRTDGSKGLIEINTNATAVRELRLAYYAVISFMDSQLGRVLDALEASEELSHNTIVTFIGDHGR